MYKEEITHYSNCLSRDMHICIYGHGTATAACRFLRFRLRIRNATIMKNSA